MLHATIVNKCVAGAIIIKSVTVFISGGNGEFRNQYWSFLENLRTVVLAKMWNIKLSA